MKNSVEIDGRVYPLPLIGQRCPRCHRPAPRLDGIPCRLCAPTCGTLTDPKTGITHAYKNGCNKEVDLVGLKLKLFNVGPVTVTCMECIATTVVDEREEMLKYAADDAKNMVDVFEALRAAGFPGSL